MLRELIVRESKKSCDGYVFVYSFPVNTNAAPNQLPLLPLFICGMMKAWKPCERRTDLASIRKTDVYIFIVEVNACC